MKTTALAILLVLSIAPWSAQAAPFEHSAEDSTTEGSQLVLEPVRVYQLPDVEVTALRIREGTDVRGSFAPSGPWDASRIESIERKRWYQRWWVWGVLGTSVVAAGHLWLSRPGGGDGKISVAVTARPAP